VKSDNHLHLPDLICHSVKQYTFIFVLSLLLATLSVAILHFASVEILCATELSSGHNTFESIINVSETCTATKNVKCHVFLDLKKCIKNNYAQFWRPAQLRKTV